MADRSFLTRLRTSGGPSHDLLVLLDQHRVMTSSQLARATGAPERTIRYRIERLHKANLIDCARPGRERESAPRHWWLRPTGARLIAGTAAAEGRPSGMFVAHAAAITEVWLAVTEHGPARGIRVDGWLTDRAGWQEWQRTDRWSSHPHRLTPDAVATLSLNGVEGVAYVEVDLASMTQAVLKQKVNRYLAYVDDLVWQDRYPYCPPMLLLTTTATRAANFVRTAGQVLAQHGRRTDPAPTLVIAACGHVRDPARAVTEPRWALPDASVAEVTLAELLSERLHAKAASDSWLYQRDVVQRRKDDIDALRSVASFDRLANLLGSDKAAEMLRLLVGADPAAFLDTEPDLAAQIVDWSIQRRRVDRFKARDLAQPMVAVLEAPHAATWAGQALRLLAAAHHIDAGHPRLHRLATALAVGSLVSDEDLAILDTPPTTSRAQIQQQILGDYLACRSAAIDREWHHLGRRDRRRTTLAQLVDASDAEHLLVCELGEGEPAEVTRQLRRSTGALVHGLSRHPAFRELLNPRTSTKPGPSGADGATLGGVQPFPVGGEDLVVAGERRAGHGRRDERRQGHTPSGEGRGRPGHQLVVPPPGEPKTPRPVRQVPQERRERPGSRQPESSVWIIRDCGSS